MSRLAARAESNPGGSLSGAASSGQTDSGASARLFGTFLSWLNDHQSDVFVVCTANDVNPTRPWARCESGHEHAVGKPRTQET